MKQVIHIILISRDKYDFLLPCNLINMLVYFNLLSDIMNKSSLDSTNRLLRVIIALLLRKKDEQILTLRQQIEILNDLGIKSAEIAEILGRSNTYINKELSIIRKSLKKKT